MKVLVISKSLVKVDLEYQNGGLSEANIRELIKLLEKALFKMRDLERKDEVCLQGKLLFGVSAGEKDAAGV
jgi:hypothetical protein